MWDWLDAIKLWIEEIPLRFVDFILHPAADYINSLSPIDNTPASFFVGLTTDVLQLANLMGIPEALLIVASAYPVRFMLQLIPFVRLGS